MEWSAKFATNAYLDSLKLCGKYKREGNNPNETQRAGTNEFISALAAGMRAKLIVEVTSEVSSSTVALAAAARQTGGRLVCIVPEPNLQKSQKAIDDSGLNDMVEFKTGNPVDVLPNYENIDFSLVDCKSDSYGRLFEKLDVNQKGSVVVANNLLEGEKGLEIGCLKGVESQTEVRSVKPPIGKGMEITRIGKSNDFRKRERSKSASFCVRADRKGAGIVKKSLKSKWVFEVDEKTGEEHIFRLPRSLSQSNGGN